MQTHLPENLTPRNSNGSSTTGEPWPAAKNSIGAQPKPAFASLLTEGTRIRMTGQDSQRVIRHRHAVIRDRQWSIMPFSISIPTNPTSRFITARLRKRIRFEYGYRIDSPNELYLGSAVWRLC